MIALMISMKSMVIRVITIIMLTNDSNKSKNENQHAILIRGHHSGLGLSEFSSFGLP